MRARFAQAHDARHIQRARPHAALMPAAVHLRRQLHARIAAPHIKRAHALRPVHFVRADRHQIDVVVDHVHRNLADRLRAVGMKQHAAFAGDLADLANRLQHADFVIGVHDADQDRFVRDRGLQLIQIHQAVLLHRQIRHPRAVFFQPLAGVENRLVLGRRGDDVVAFFGIHLGHALQRQVVRFRRAAGENDFFRSRADQARHLLARLLRRFFRFPAEAVIAAGRVAEDVRQVRPHRLKHARIDRRGGVIVHVDG